MALTDAEIQSLRHHLGYGNVSTGAYPYTPDGFYELFTSVISPNLQTGAETTSATATTAGASTAIVVEASTGIVAYARLVIDVGDQAEIVTVKAVSGLNVTAYFTIAHSGTYPVAVESGVSRLRMLLHRADAAWQALTSGKMFSGAGIKQVDEVHFFDPKSGGASAQLAGTRKAYEAVVWEISSLVRVLPRWASQRAARTVTETY